MSRKPKAGGSLPFVEWVKSKPLIASVYVSPKVTLDFYATRPNALMHQCAECNSWFEISTGYQIDTLVDSLTITPSIQCPRCEAVYSIITGVYQVSAPVAPVEYQEDI